MTCAGTPSGSVTAPRSTRAVEGGDDGRGELIGGHRASLSAGPGAGRTGFTPWPTDAPGSCPRVRGVTTHPTYDQLIDLPAYVEQPVPMPFEDINGHLNVRHYIGIASEGLDESLVEVGIPQMWPLSHGHACFTAEHHVTYLNELRTGDTMSARVRLLGRSERAAHVPRLPARRDAPAGGVRGRGDLPAHRPRDPAHRTLARRRRRQAGRPRRRARSLPFPADTSGSLALR